MISTHTIDGLKMHVTHDTIQAKGFEPWYSVRYMTTDESRVACCEWYAGLVKRGVIKPLVSTFIERMPR